MSDAPPKRHRVHHGLSGARLERGGVMLEFWRPCEAPDGQEKPYHIETLSSAEWVDLVSNIIVGDAEVSATDLNALRTDISRLHERWRASVTARAIEEQERREDGD